MNAVADEKDDGGSGMSGTTKEDIRRREIWLRLFFMIVLTVALDVAGVVTFAVVVFQFFASLFSGHPNDRLARFGRNLARYLQQIIIYLTFATEEKPFPFAPWPDEPHEKATAEGESKQLSDESEKAEEDEAGEAKRRMTRRPPTLRKTRTSRKTKNSAIEMN